MDYIGTARGGGPYSRTNSQYKSMSVSLPRQDSNTKVIHGQYTGRYLKACARNIYSDDDTLSNDDDKIGAQRSSTELFNTIYQTRKITHLEKQLKNEFLTFRPVSFVNENAEDQTYRNESDDEAGTLKDRKREHIREIYLKKLKSGSVDCSPNIIPDLWKADRDVLAKSMNKTYMKKHEEWAIKNTMSHQQRKVPSSLLPNVTEGNYSLLLHDRDVSEVNQWVEDDLRLCGCEFTDKVKEDLEKFDAFDTFNDNDLDVTKL